MRIVSFWGKGGVGKTTCSASLATGLSELEGKDVLLITTDPTPTLSDVLGTNIGSRPMKIDGFTSLYAMEIDEETVINEWKERFGDEVYEVLSSFLPVEKDILDYISRAPGIADQFMLYVLYEIWKESEYDFVVWDTPASSGSIRLLRIEEEFYSHLGDAIRMYLKLKGFFEKIRRREKDPLHLIEEWRELARGIFDMLTSSEHFLYLISIPERVSYLITKRLYDELMEFGINTRAIIVNRLIKECNCFKNMREVHLKVLKEFKANFEKVYVIENEDYEPVGKDGLLKFYSHLEGLL